MPYLFSPETQVLPARLPADHLTGLRVFSHATRPASAVLPLPVDVHPSLTHLGVLADSTCAQPIGVLLEDGYGMRTLSLHVQLVDSPRPGEWVLGEGKLLSFNGTHGLTRSELHRHDGTLLAIASGRFMTVRAAIDRAESTRRERFGDLTPPAPWDWAYGLDAAHSPSEASSAQVVLTAHPHELTRNNAPIMHGGLHLRLAELGMRAVAGLPEYGGHMELTDIDVLFHNPVPVTHETPVAVRGVVQRRSRRVILAEARIESMEGKVLTVAQGTFLPAENS